MNARRTFLRIWMVATIVWFAVVAAFSWEEIARPVLADKAYVYSSDACRTENLSAKALRCPDLPIWEMQHAYDRNDLAKSGFEEVALPNNVYLMVRAVDRDASQDSIQQIFDAIVRPRASQVSAKRISSLGYALGAALVPPLVLFVLAGSLLWAVAGFTKRT
jgi:hypothetical protein